MNQKIKLIPLLLFSAFATQAAKDVKVMQYLHAGPITVNKPILTDSLNVDGKPFEAKNLVKSTIPFGRALGNAAVIDADTAGLITVPTPEKGYALHLYSFYLNSDRYTKGSLEVSGAGTFEVFVNNKPVGATSELALEPHRYEVVIKYLTADTDTCPSTLTAKFKSEEEAKVIASLDPEKRYTPRDILEGTQFRGTSVSPDGKYVLVKYYTRKSRKTKCDGREKRNVIFEAKTKCAQKSRLLPLSSQNTSVVQTPFESCLNDAFLLNFLLKYHLKPIANLAKNRIFT